MKKLFNGFYDVKDKLLEKIWNEENTLFVFDTNVLLNLYSYAEASRNDFFSLLENQKVIDRIWIPYHVGLEYQRRRLGIVRTEKKVFNDIEVYLESIRKSLKSDKINNLKLEQRLPHIKSETEKLHENILKEIDAYSELVEIENKKHPDVRSSDKIRKRIDKLFNLKVGEKPITQDYLDKLYADGKKRYDHKIPPGYMDRKEKENEDDYSYSDLIYKPMYGDLIIWNQIIDRANNEDIKSIIFITDDAKEDWRFSIDSNGKKLMGARAELREEICRKSNIDNFLILTSFEFMGKGKDILSVKIEETSITEIKESFDKKIKNRYDNLVNISELTEFTKDYNEIDSVSTLSRLLKNNKELLSFDKISKLTKDYNEMNSVSKLYELLKKNREFSYSTSKENIDSDSFDELSDYMKLKRYIEKNKD